MTAKTRKSAHKVPKGTRFEDALGELETLVRSLESGDASLEESIDQFERGVALSRHCRQSLGEAEQKVKVLLEEDGEERLEAFEDAQTTGNPAPGERA